MLASVLANLLDKNKDQTVGVFELISVISSELKKNPSIRNCDQEALWVFEEAFNQKINTSFSVILQEEPSRKLLKMVLERLDGKPLAYVLGNVEFCDIKIISRPPVFIPRPETEHWVQGLISSLEKYADRPFKILELCSGTGCISLAIASRFPLFSIVSVDIDPKAAALARENKEKLRILNVDFREGDLFQALNKDEKFDFIISNPPYIGTDRRRFEVENSVLDWESHLALFSGTDGLDIVRKILNNGKNFLKEIQEPLPRFLIEISSINAQESLLVGKKEKYHSVIHYDQYNVARVLVCFEMPKEGQIIL